MPFWRCCSAYFYIPSFDLPIVGASERALRLQRTGTQVGGDTPEAFAPPRARDIAEKLNATHSGAAKSVPLSGAIERGQLELRREIADEAAHGLLRREPQFSAATVVTPSQRSILLLLACGIILLLSFRPATGGMFLTGLVLAGYLANGIFRAWLFWVGSEDAGLDAASAASIPDGELPIYTVLVPLYREANVLPQLAAALLALDYPPDRLDLKLVVEEDDAETVAAAGAVAHDGSFDVIAVPVGEPRTKPRACNYALPFARGELLVIFDAEDRPEPDQLKRAVRAFHNHPANVVCLQARLNFYDARARWLSKMFALDYALWFDVLLPGLDRLRIPMPLGGTSNHFKVDALRAIHGWDPFNVTEDADLGIRLARLGLSVRTLDSTTYEEATRGIGNWLRQRTRWMKGYMQTWLVHMRNPRQLLRDAGPGGFLGFQLFVGGTVLSALLNPVLWLLFLMSCLARFPMLHFLDVASPFSGLGLLLGNGLFAYLAMLGPHRRGWVDLSPYALAAPIYWLLISIAAYRALWHLARKPWHWEKTDHGVGDICMEEAE